MIRSNVHFEVMKFPCGEPHVTIAYPDVAEKEAAIHFEFESAEEIIILSLLVDAMNRSGIKPAYLEMPYIPFSRQDRVANPGENFSLKVFCDLINGLGFEDVHVTDPHSDVAVALLNNVRVRTQWDVFRLYFPSTDFWLVCPDGGALKKIFKLSAATRTKPLGIVQCTKERDTMTGELLRSVVHAEELFGKDCYIVDDICDGGGTFVEIAKRLKDLNAGKIHLMVTHGFFTKGLKVFDGLIDHIYTRKGQIK